MKNEGSMKNQSKSNSTTDGINALNFVNQHILLAEEDGDQADLEPLLADGFSIIRASGVRQDRQAYLDAVTANAHRGRTADQPEVQLYGDCAVFTCIVTTTQNSDGTPNPGRFWNTRVFVREKGEWHCAAWQVTKITQP